MGKIKDEITQVSKKLNLKVVVIDDADNRRIRHDIVRKYQRKNVGPSLWERIEGGFGFQDHDAWRYIEEFVRRRPIILFFEPDREDSMFLVHDGATLTVVLENSSLAEFYVTDDRYSMLICHNRYDFLIAFGAAEDWLRQKYQLIHGSHSDAG